MDSNDKVTIYELGFHITTALPEEKLGAEVSVIKEVLEKAGAEMISEEFPKRITLAYTIFKKTQNGTIKLDEAYFGWVKFAVDSEKIEEIKKACEANANIARFLIVKTVRENTMPVKVFNSEKTNTEDDEKKEEITEDDEKKIDESIAELVIE